MKELKEFEVIGYKIKLKDNDISCTDGVTADQIVELVNNEAEKVRAKNPALESGQVATLAALKIASDILKMEKDFKENIFNLQGNANRALDYIKDFTPEAP